jgi:hypothetical protein
MIGRDQIDIAIGERLPQPFSIRTRPVIRLVSRK